ncbi:MAG: hypothetical protein P8H22_05175 [Glaciecola sp.]|jgi:hypothetical protein|nr:hypothetical protein [Glaciecola sp.]
MKILIQTILFMLIITSSLAAHAQQPVPYKVDDQTEDQTASDLAIKPTQPTCDKSDNVD